MQRLQTQRRGWRDYCFIRLRHMRDPARIDPGSLNPTVCFDIRLRDFRPVTGENLTMRIKSTRVFDATDGWRDSERNVSLWRRMARLSLLALLFSTATASAAVSRIPRGSNPGARRVPQKR